MVPAGDEKEATALSGYARLLPFLPPSPSPPAVLFFFFFGTNEVSEGPRLYPNRYAPVLVVFILTRMHAYVYMHLKYSTVGP